MNSNSAKNWQAIIGLVSEMKRCDECDITTGAIAIAFICIDTLASLGRPMKKQKVTRSDFKEWVDTYLKAHPDQPYQYRGKDVYAARCAFMHTYGSSAELHEEDSDTIKFAYNDGGKHQYDPDIEHGLVLIGTKSFVNDVVHAVELFLEKCQNDLSLRLRVEERLPGVLKTMPYHP
ncbi:MAG: hypothetical protein H7Y05_11885 [Steroidobacteraceae bacterium]|nr:hypothetical protein [Deltaproteobacteria bacterium]